MKKIFIALAGLMISFWSVAQPDIEDVKAELYKINKVFDSSRYLGFDLRIEYNSDTLFGRYQHEEMTGRYLLNDRWLYYKMGHTEYMQNDSFVYSIYHDEKMLMMTKDIIAYKSDLFPLKVFVDSIITWYEEDYTITLGEEDDYEVIEFTTTDTELPYQRFAIYYDSATHYPAKFEMSSMASLDYFEIPDSLSSIIRIRPPRTRIVMEFSNYGFSNSLDIFKDENYVYFDRQRKRYQPAQKFKAFRFVANGVEADPNSDDTIEVYPPPVDQ